MTVENQPAQVSLCNQNSKPSVNSGCDVGECNIGNPANTGTLSNGGSSLGNSGSLLDNGRSSNRSSVGNGRFSNKNGETAIAYGGSSFNVVGSSYSASWFITQWTQGVRIKIVMPKMFSRGFSSILIFL